MVEIVTDPLKFAEAMVAFRPTHVVSDLHMPTRSGLEVLAEARRIDPTAVRALLSGSLQTVSKESLREVEPVRLIAKPWNTPTLLRDLGVDDGGAAP